MAEPALSHNLEFFRKKYPGEYRKAAMQDDECGTAQGIIAALNISIGSAYRRNSLRHDIFMEKQTRGQQQMLFKAKWRAHNVKFF